MINGSFTKKKVGTLTLGEKLRKLRSDRRLALNEVSRVTRIQIGYLESLEAGDYDKLPADVYVKGFLRSYSEFLGVDEKIIIKLYEKEKGIKKNLEKSKNPEDPKAKIEPINISSFVFTSRKIIFTFVILAVFTAFFFLYKEIGNFASTPRLIIASPAANAEVNGNSVFVEGITDKDAKLFINDQPILVNDDGKFRELITLQSGVNVINIKSVSKFDKETVETVSIKNKAEEMVAGETANNEENREEGAVENDSKEIQMEIRVEPGPVWLSVESDGNLVFSGTMLSGAIQSFRAKEKISINSGKANATFVKFNGKDIGALSQDPGAVRGATFTNDTKY
ncbi:MAG TPA: DUF4115 domain-containing protein [Candidatus Moranbacteria bacterium]|nr:DUF4115 domain-containing protein [Candidatus Moranbacteria bacterium]